MDIVKMLTISTAHITKRTADMLDAIDTPFDVCIYDKGTALDKYGWFLTDWTLQEETRPEDLRACCKFAERNDCAWLCLDCDGEVVDCLPTYEWEE